MKTNKTKRSELIQLSSTVKMDFYERIDINTISEPITQELIPIISTKGLKESKKSINHILYHISSYEQHCRNLENKEYSDFDKEITKETESTFNLMTKECIGIFKMLVDMENILWDYKRRREEDCESSILKNLKNMNNSLVTINKICTDLIKIRTQRKDIIIGSVNCHLTICLFIINGCCLDILTDYLFEKPNPSLQN